MLKRLSFSMTDSWAHRFVDKQMMHLWELKRCKDDAFTVNVMMLFWSSSNRSKYSFFFFFKIKKSRNRESEWIEWKNCKKKKNCENWRSTSIFIRKTINNFVFRPLLIHHLRSICKPPQCISAKDLKLF